ncbi:hypothetical protein HPB47_017201 [Ixodes persulcatus]|uniref:Uncharacterized protein n=1 Tax=Ixodes persulcatus TaxID=34615 RepID=A0AC60QNY0_IXOPE|nr:hypothetical protein HPB47_017201 [Ixodes persulcatus]
MPVERTPPKTSRPSDVLSPGRLPFVEDADARASRRAKVQLPESEPLLQKLKKIRTMTTPPVVVVPVAPRTPTPFLGEIYEDVDDWINQRWFENHEASLTSWELCKSELTRTFVNQHRRERAEDLLQSWTQGPNDSVTSFVKDVLRLSSRADPQATEEKKQRILMRGVKDDIFGGLVRNPPMSVQGFVTEATNIERALQARASHYQRLPGLSAVSQSPCNLAHDTPGIRELIRDIVREELKKLLPTAERPASISIAEVVRDEVQRAFLPDAPVTMAAADEPTLTYAAVARRPPPTAQYHPVAPRRDPPTQAYPRRTDEVRQYDRREQPAPRKTDVWRTADRRPICYHCGEADHIYRRCPYRQMGLRGFHPNDPRPSRHTMSSSNKRTVSSTLCAQHVCTTTKCLCRFPRIARTSIMLTLSKLGPSATKRDQAGQTFLARLADFVRDHAPGRHFHVTSVMPAPSAPSQHVIDPACMRMDCTIFKVDDSHGGSSDFMLPGVPQVILFGDITLDRPIFDRASTVTSVNKNIKCPPTGFALSGQGPKTNKTSQANLGPNTRSRRNPTTEHSTAADGSGSDGDYADVGDQPTVANMFAQLLEGEPQFGVGRLQHRSSATVFSAFKEIVAVVVLRAASLAVEVSVPPHVVPADRNYGTAGPETVDDGHCPALFLAALHPSGFRSIQRAKKTPKTPARRHPGRRRVVRPRTQPRWRSDKRRRPGLKLLKPPSDPPPHTLECRSAPAATGRHFSILSAATWSPRSPTLRQGQCPAKRRQLRCSELAALLSSAASSESAMKRRSAARAPKSVDTVLWLSLCVRRGRGLVHVASRPSLEVLFVLRALEAYTSAYLEMAGMPSAAYYRKNKFFWCGGKSFFRFLKTEQTCGGRGGDDSSSEDDNTGGAWHLKTGRRKPQHAKGARLDIQDLPRITLVVKPTSQVKIANIQPRAQASTKHLTSPCCEGNRAYYCHGKNNTIAITVYKEKHAQDILGIKEIPICERKPRKTVQVNTYRSTSSSLPRGVIHGISSDVTAGEVANQTEADYHDHELVHTRPIGRMCTYLLTFGGQDVPRRHTTTEDNCQTRAQEDERLRKTSAAGQQKLLQRQQQQKMATANCFYSLRTDIKDDFPPLNRPGTGRKDEEGERKMKQLAEQQQQHRRRYTPMAFTGGNSKAPSQRPKSKHTEKDGETRNDPIQVLRQAM